MKKILIYLLIINTIILIFGCQSGITAKVSAYTTLEEGLARDIFKSFTEETGIKVDWIRLSTGECVARMEAEKENPQASIWLGGVGLGHIEAKNKGLTQAYNSPNANMPSQFRDPDYFWTGIYAGPLCFESNTVKLKQYGLKAPTSWDEIASPEYSDHVQMAHPGSSGTSYNILSTVVQIFGEDEAFEYLKGLDKNITQYTRSGLAPGKNMSIGEVAVAIGYAHDAIRLKKEGYPITITFPSEGTGYEIASISLIKNGPEKEESAARILYDWALGENAARIFAAKYVVPFVDVPLPDGSISIFDVNIIKQNDEWAAANKQRLVEKWNETIGSDERNN